MARKERSRIFICSANDASSGVGHLFSAWGRDLFSGARVAVKANFNSADPFPAGTDPLTLFSILAELRNAGAGAITIAERSGMGDTRTVLESLGIFEGAEQHRCTVRVIDTLGADGFVRVRDPRHHWRRGFLIARDFVDAQRVVQTCCLKTHRFGGHFTLSLKNSVGTVAKHDPADGYEYMRELHGSPSQRSLIAEINTAYRTDLIIMDARTGFGSGGPERGVIITPGVMLAGSDRVAIDSVGVAILRTYSTTADVARGPIAGLEQISRAAQLGVGTANPEKIELVPLDSGADHISKKIRDQLTAEGKD